MQGNANGRDDLVGDGDNRVCLAGRDVRKVGRVARSHCLLLEPLEIEDVDLRPNRFGLQRNQHDEVMGLAELGGSVHERGLRAFSAACCAWKQAMRAGSSQHPQNVLLSWLHGFDSRPPLQSPLQ